MSREKLYTFTVPVTISAMRTVCVKAENEDDACDKFRETDWYDCKTDEYEEEYDETATTNATQAIKTTASNIDDEDEDDDQEEEITTTTPTSEVEYYDDDEPIKVTVSSDSPTFWCPTSI